jgi:molybdopterin molybdotransferase
MPRASGRLQIAPLDIANAISEAIAAHDLTVIVGGASVGDHDHARPAVRDLGGVFLFEKVALRPGKPTWFARIGGRLVLGLPGNPASAFVCARLFLASAYRSDVRTRSHDVGAGFAKPAHARRSAPTDRARPIFAPRPPPTRAVKPGSRRRPDRIRRFSRYSPAPKRLIVRAPDAPEAPAGALVDVLYP